MKIVFVLQHEHEWYGRDEIKFIGVYDALADAEVAASRLREQPGFRDWPDGFTIDRYEIGVDHWVEGFITIVYILVPSKGKTGGYHVAGSLWRPGDLYEISDLEEPEDAVFSVGDVVRCEERSVSGHGESALVAVEVIRDSA
jgi:hypothetical protein